MTAQPNKILVVDDEENILEVLQLLLERGGYEVVTACSPHEALKRLETYRPDLIISDVNMPGMDGYELFQRIQANPETATVPFLFLTARGGREDVLAGKELGADDYLVKPMTNDELLASVRGKLRRVKQRDAERRSQVDSLKRQILNVLSHEFVTPLVSIKGTAELLLSDDVEFSENELRSFLTTIKSGGDRLGKLVDDFIMSVKMQSGNLRQEAQLLKETFDVRSVVSRVADAFREHAASKGVQIVTDLPDQPAVVEAYSEHVKEAVDRLVDNAVKYISEPRGSVALRVVSETRNVRITVTDTGVGIPPGEMEFIFKPFHQVDRQTREQQGPGLGLPLAHGLAEANGGSIHVSSQVGTGSTFELRFPRAGSA